MSKNSEWYLCNIDVYVKARRNNNNNEGSSKKICMVIKLTIKIKIIFTTYSPCEYK